MRHLQLHSNIRKAPQHQTPKDSEHTCSISTHYFPDSCFNLFGLVALNSFVSSPNHGATKNRSCFEFLSLFTRSGDFLIADFFMACYGSLSLRFPDRTYQAARTGRMLTETHNPGSNTGWVARAALSGLRETVRPGGRPPGAFFTGKDVRSSAQTPCGVILRRQVLGEVPMLD